MHGVISEADEVINEAINGAINIFRIASSDKPDILLHILSRKKFLWNFQK